MNTAFIDPYYGHEYIVEVEALLGGIGCLVFEGGLCQFSVYDDQGILYIYSPRLLAPALNDFCALHLCEYRRISIQHRNHIQKNIPFKIELFWE